MSSNVESQKDNLRIAAKALLASVEETTDDGGSVYGQCKSLVDLFNPKTQSGLIAQGLTAKKQEILLLNVLRASNKPFMKRFFPALHSIVERIVSEAAYVPESVFVNDGSDDQDKDYVQRGDENAVDCLAFLKYAAMCAEAVVEEKVSRRKENARSEGFQVQISSQVFDVASQLHNILLSVHDCGDEGLAARNAILSLCESCWQGNVVDRESLIAQVLPLLVLQASDPNEFQKSRIKKLLNFKDAFHVIDFLNPSSDSLRSLLLKVASNPLCLKLPEGRKFLISLFRDPDLFPDLHQAFRAQIPHVSKTILQAYGEIYYKSWCAAEDASDTETQEVLEHQVLQDIMHAVIHIASPTMAKSLLIILEPLHVDKKAERVANLLNRLYGPILWRSLSAANAGVRRNAVAILERVYPLHDPHQNQMKAAMERCSAALKNALKDVDAKVRVAASEATANICTLFWEVLPSSDIRMLLNHIVLEHASDAASAAVRAQALATATVLLELPQSHAVLRPLLPSLGNLVHDKAEKVRLAAVKLLRCIKRTPGIHFYHVVPVDHLSARFSEEERVHRNPKNTVNKELTALMLSSYFPQGGNVSAGDQIQRTMTFLVSDPDAAASFYANLADFLEVESVTKFIVMLLTCLNSAVQSEQVQLKAEAEASKKRRRARAKPAAEASVEQKLSASNTKLMVALAETISTLLESIQESLELPANEAAQKLLLTRFGEINLARVLAHFEQKIYADEAASSSEETIREESLRVCHAILRCASWMPTDSIEGVRDFVTDSLHAIARDENIPAVHASANLALLASWGTVDDIVPALASPINSAFDDDMGLSILSPLVSDSGGRNTRKSSLKGKNKKAQGKKFRFPDFTPKFACRVIDDILRGPSAASVVLRKSLLESAVASQTIGNSLKNAFHFAERMLENNTTLGASFDEVEIDTILECCEAYVRLTLHLTESEDNEQPMKEMHFLLDWTTEHVLPVLVKSAVAGSDLQDLDLSRISNVSDSFLLNSCSSLMSPPKQRINMGDSTSRLSCRRGSSAPSYHSLGDLVARIMMQSACLFVSEFLLIDGRYSSNIEKNVSQWCTVFEAREGADERTRQVQGQLLPSFARLGVQLCKYTGNFDLLKALLVNFHNTTEIGSEDMFRQVFKSLLQAGFKGNTALADRLTDTLLEAFSEIALSSETMQAFEKAEKPDAIWSSSSVSAVIEVISTNSEASRGLAEKLFSKLKLHTGDVDNKVVFYAKCLSYLLYAINSDNFVEKLREGMNMDNLHDERMRTMMVSLVGVSA